MVDGDQLNVVGDQTIVSVADRNVKEFDIIPLFYDAGFAAPEMISNEALFHGLKRAHEGSNIGEISNMLTRLWNKDNPDRYAAALITRKNNAIIDQAKTGYLVDWTDNPELTRRINKATGGIHGRLPHWFQFSKNGRAAEKKAGKKKLYAKPNKSTMNRICAAFDDIGNINMNYAEIPPFNYQMLMSGPFYGKDNDIVQTFYDLDGMSISAEIALAEIPPHERSSAGMYEMLAEIITETMTEKFGSLEHCYPFIVKALFAGEGCRKASHKKMFWRVFGEIALRNLEANLQDYRVCPFCDAKIPKWAKDHDCPKSEQGFFTCIVCGKKVNRINSKQCRCDECQKDHRDEVKRLSALKRRKHVRESEELCISSLLSSWTATWQTERSGRPTFSPKAGPPANEDQDG